MCATRVDVCASDDRHIKNMSLLQELPKTPGIAQLMRVRCPSLFVGACEDARAPQRTRTLRRGNLTVFANGAYDAVERYLFSFRSSLDVELCAAGRCQRVGGRVR